MIVGNQYWIDTEPLEQYGFFGQKVSQWVIHSVYLFAVTNKVESVANQPL